MLVLITYLFQFFHFVSHVTINHIIIDGITVAVTEFQVHSDERISAIKVQGKAVD